MARVLIVGCGCRGRVLATELVARGHVVRGTSRVTESLALIEAAGAQAVHADPDRLATLIPALDHVAVLVLLLGSAAGPPDAVRALHQERLEALLRALLDSTARGVVYEAAGTLPADLLEVGAAIVERACEASRIPFAAPRVEPGDGWLAAHSQAVERVLAADA